MKKKLYLVLDTETATLPFSDTLCKDEKQKQKIAIAKPLVYDIGWTITDRQGNIIKKENYLVQETFFVPAVFNTAYYKEKRPVYIKMLKEKEIKTDTWNNIISTLEKDLSIIDFVCAYNASFDFKKAIPFTENYIKNLYSDNFNNWEKEQYKKCKNIIEGKDNSHNKEYLVPIFKLRNQEYKIIDLWSLACQKLINNDNYKTFCIKNDLISHSVEFFKTSAESSFRYLMKDYNFIEEHTALSDALIESKILVKALKKGRVEPIISAFPFKELGTTADFVKRKPKHRKKILNALYNFISDNDGFNKTNNGYWSKIVKLYNSIKEQA